MLLFDFLLRLSLDEASTCVAKQLLIYFFNVICVRVPLFFTSVPSCNQWNLRFALLSVVGEDNDGKYAVGAH